MIGITLSCGLWLAACGGGKQIATTPDDSIVETCSACAPDTLVGTAAGGAPIAGAELHLVDSVGTRVTASVDANGVFQLPTAGLVAPLLIEVSGMVGGRPAVLHSTALSADFGANAVNVTPLTEIMTAFVLGQDPQDVFNQALPDLSKITPAAVAAAEMLVATKLQGILAAFGVESDNIRTTEFTADGTGLDGALDSIKLTPVQDASGKTVYELVIVTEDSPVVIDPSNFADTSLGFVNEAMLTAIAAVLPPINAQLQALAAQFATAMPTAPALAPFFKTDTFYHNGMSFDVYLSTVLLKPAATDGIDYVGHKVSRVAVEKFVDENNVQVSYTVTFAGQAFPRSISTLMTKVSGQWLIGGNQRIADVFVTYLARIVEKPLTLDEIKALPGVEEVQITRGDDPTLVTCYRLLRPEGSYVWIGCPDEGGTFGLIAWSGSAYDDPNTAVNEREQSRQLTTYIGHASARVRPYVNFFVSSSEVDPRVAKVVVHGPGMPLDGVVLTRPKSNIPRDFFILENDIMDWWSFNTERCQYFNAPKNCALDWSQIMSGSSFTFLFVDANGLQIGAVTERLFGRPRAVDEWFANKDRFFPQLTLAPSDQWSINNLYDSASGKLVDGGTVNLQWTLPTDPTVKVSNVWASREYWMHNDMSVATDQRKETHGAFLLGTNTTSWAATFDNSGGALTTWGWATVEAHDVYGNALSHEVSPVNPY